MPHNIQILSDGRECFVENSLKERAWHGLGTTFDRPLTMKEALEGCHANWEVEKRDLFFPSAELGKVLMSNEKMTAQEFMRLFSKVGNVKTTVRTDLEQSLGVVSDKYGIVQNVEAFDFIDTLTGGKFGDKTPTIECAGVLGNGERIFVTAKLNEQIALANNANDLVEMYFVFTTSHDGTGAVNCLVTPIRVVCQNTLNYAFKHNSGRLSFKHTLNVSKRLDLAEKGNFERAASCLKLAEGYKKYFEENAIELAKIRLNDKQVENILVDALLTPQVQKIYYKNGQNINHEDIPTRSQNIITNVTEAIFSGIGQENLENGTGLKVINGVTTYYQNNFNWNNDTNRKFDAIMSGTVQSKVQAVHNAIMFAA